MNPDVWCQEETSWSIPSFENYTVLVSEWTDRKITLDVINPEGELIIHAWEMDQEWNEDTIKNRILDVLEDEYDAAHSTVGRSLGGAA